MSPSSWQRVLLLILVQTDTEFYFQILRNFVKIWLQFPWFIILLKLGLNMTFDEKNFQVWHIRAEYFFLEASTFSSAIPKPGNDYSSINLDVGSSYLRDETYFSLIFSPIFSIPVPAFNNVPT